MRVEKGSLRYSVWFLAKTIGGLIRRHGLNTTNISNFEVLEEFNFAKDIEHWEAFLKSEFDILKNTRGLVTFGWKLQVIHFFRVMDALGFNYKNVLHVSSRVRFLNCDTQAFENSKLQFHAQLTNIFRRSKTSVALQFLHTVQSENSETIYECFDEVAVLGFKETFLNEKERAGSFAGSNFAQIESDSLATPEAKKGERIGQIQFAMPEGVGIRFGKVSGDLNPLHTNPFLAKILGHRNAFAQGMLIVNVLVNQLFSYSNQKEFFFKFIKPMYIGENYCLSIYPEYFSVSAADNHIVCAGEFK